MEGPLKTNVLCFESDVSFQFTSSLEVNSEKINMDCVFLKLECYELIYKTETDSTCIGNRLLVAKWDAGSRKDRVRGWD